MPINEGLFFGLDEGLFFGLDGTTFTRYVHAAVAACQRGSPQSSRYERTTRLDADGRVIFQPPRPTLVCDLNHPAAQAPMAARKP